MGHNKTHEKFAKDFVESFPDLKLLSKYMGGSKYIDIEDADGVQYNVQAQALMGKKYIPSIVSAIDKNKAFAVKGKKKFGDRFDYSKVKYVVSNKEVKITCSKHGEINMTPNAHLTSVTGCKKCGTEQRAERIRDTKENFIKKAKAVHGDKYDYSLVKYINSKTKVKLVCLDHGEFEIKPEKHTVAKQGCYDCGQIATHKKQALTLEQFVERASIMHGGKYDYSLVEYSNSSTKVPVLCPHHGKFYQSPEKHLIGQGCKYCGYEKSIWTPEQWHESGQTSTFFKEYKVYVIEVWDGHERFYKIGKTYVKISARFNKSDSTGGVKLPYSYKVLKIMEDKFDGIKISYLETLLHSTFKDVRYKPKKKFGGKTECFSKIDLDLIDGTAKSFLDNYKD